MVQCKLFSGWYDTAGQRSKRISLPTYEHIGTFERIWCATVIFSTRARDWSSPRQPSQLSSSVFIGHTGDLRRVSPTRKGYSSGQAWAGTLLITANNAQHAWHTKPPPRPGSRCCPYHCPSAPGSTCPRTCSPSRASRISSRWTISAISTRLTFFSTLCPGPL